MTLRRKIFVAFMGVLFGTSVVHADMMSVYRLDFGHRQPTNICNRADFRYTDLNNPYNFTSVTGLDSRSVEFLEEVNTDNSQNSGMQNPQILTDGTGSFSLCLSALIGLGMFSSAHLVKKLSLGFIPEWYHNGGPFQIGHSLIMPESFHPVLVCCFIQPICIVEDSLIQYRLRTVVSLWRKSQFIPTILVPRGPPNMS